MAIIVGVQFQKNGKVYTFDANGLDLRTNDFVVADTSHGKDLGQVVVGCREQPDSESEMELKKIIRVATDRDIQASAANREKEKEAFSICQKKIAEHQLDMKLVSVEYAFDNSKALFYFTANGRVDFRSLVKDLASIFKMRIELRQIGVRDEARMIGGLGPCGRQICCGAFLDEFQPVSIKMAKEQNLSLNPTKISGVCGRLMCCLKYEQDHYEQTRKIMPKIGKEVITPDGNGTVTDLNIVKETVFVRITNGDSSEIREYPLTSIEKSVSSFSRETEKKKPESVPVKDENSTEEEDFAQDPEGFNPFDEESVKESRSERRDPNGRKDRSREPKRKEKKEPAEKKNPALGKPVMRENPNRNANSSSPQQSPETKQASSLKQVSVPHPSPAPSEKKTTASNWADAVRKAMDSIS